MAKTKSGDDSGSTGNIIRINPRASKFAKAKIQENTARLTVLRWVAVLYVVQIGVYLALALTGRAVESEKVYELLKIHTTILVGVAGFNLPVGRVRSP